MRRAFRAAVLAAMISGAAGLAGACGGGGDAGSGSSPQSTADASTSAEGGAVDGGGDAPSGDAGFVTAAHPRMPTVVQQRGNPSATPDIVPVSFNSQCVNAVSDLDAFVTGIVTQGYWTATTSEYGVGATKVETPVHLGEAAPATITDADIKTWLADKIASGAPGFANATDGTLFVLFYPSTSTVTKDGITLCAGLGGYHTSFSVTTDGGTLNPTYAVIPECVTPADAGAGALTTLQQATVAASHEPTSRTKEGAVGRKASTSRRAPARRCR